MTFSKLTLTTSLLTGLIVISGCSSSEDGGGGVSPPKNAITFDQTNAANAVDEAVSATDYFFSKGVAETPANNLLMQLIKNIRGKSDTSGVDFASAVAYSESVSCADFFSTVSAGSPDSVTDQGNYSDNADGYSESGSTTFYTCDFYGLGVVIDGKLNYSYKETYSTQAYSESGSGSLTLAYSSLSIMLNKIAYAGSGNYITGDYSITKLQYVYDPGVDGFSLEVSSTIMGNEFACGPTSGSFLLKGANGTKVEASFNSDASTTVKVDEGSGYVEVPGSPFPCI